MGCGGPQRARPAGSGVGGGGSSSRASFSHSVLLPFYSTPSIPSLVQPSACNTHTPMAPKYVQAWERSGRRGAGSLAQGDSVPPPGQRSACVLAGALPSRPLCAARFLPPAHLVCDEGEKGGIGVGGRPQAHAGRATGRAARRGGARQKRKTMRILDGHTLTSALGGRHATSAGARCIGSGRPPLALLCRSSRAPPCNAGAGASVALVVPRCYVRHGHACALSNCSLPHTLSHAHPERRMRKVPSA